MVELPRAIERNGGLAESERNRSVGCCRRRLRRCRRLCGRNDGTRKESRQQERPGKLSGHSWTSFAGSYFLHYSQSMPGGESLIFMPKSSFALCQSLSNRRMSLKGAKGRRSGLSFWVLKSIHANSRGGGKWESLCMIFISD